MWALSPACQKPKRLPTEVSQQIGEILLVVFLRLPVFAQLLRPNCKSDFYALIHRTSVPGYCIYRWIQLQKVPYIPIPPLRNSSNGGVNRYFQAKLT